MSKITVATLNLHGRYDRWLERRSLIVAELLDAEPDVISFQEIYRPFGQGRWLRNQINSRISGSSRGPFILIQKSKQHFISGYFEAIGILSRLPVLSRDALPLGHGGQTALRVNLELPTRETLDFVAVHLHPAAEERETRLEQVMRLIGWLNENNPVQFQVIAGDFNEIPTGLAIEQMKQLYRSVYEEAHGRDPLATFPTALVTHSDGWAGCLDYIFVSRAVNRVEDARIFCKKPASEDLELYPSDHVGLLSTLDVGRTGSSQKTRQEDPSNE